MEITVDYHTHTVFSHGKGTILENAETAKEKDLKEIAITDHGFSHPAFGLTERKVPKMIKLCNEATEITGVKVKLGIESNILGISGKTDLKQKDYEKFDIFLAGIHRFILYDKIKEWNKLLFQNFLARKNVIKPSDEFIKRNTQVYINTIKNNPIDVLAHPNYLVFANAVEVAKCCRDYGTLFEIDSRKEYLTDEDWSKIALTGVKFIIDSDAHTPSNVANVKNAVEMVKRVGINENQIVNVSGQVPNEMRFNLFKQKM